MRAHLAVFPHYEAVTHIMRGHLTVFITDLYSATMHALHRRVITAPQCVHYTGASLQRYNACITLARHYSATMHALHWRIITAPQCMHYNGASLQRVFTGAATCEKVDWHLKRTGILFGTAGSNSFFSGQKNVHGTRIAC